MDRFRAAVIGHSGRGDDGDELDVAFAGLLGVTWVAVADPDQPRRAGTPMGAGTSRADAAYGQIPMERYRVERAC